MKLVEQLYRMYSQMSYFDIFDEIKDKLNDYPKNEVIDALNDLHGQVSCDIYFGEQKSSEIIAKSEKLIREINKKLQYVN